jgi:AcrR family transcriptional regulator
MTPSPVDSPRVDRAAKILAAASRLFHERGFHGVSVDEIGKEAGVVGSALYRYFSGKDEILATLFNEAMDRVVVNTDQMFDDPRAEIDFLVRHHARFVVANRELVSIYAQEYRFLVEPWRRMFVRRMQDHATRWEHALRRCFPDADPVRIGTAVQAAIGMLHSVVYWPPALLDSPHLVDWLHEQVMSGVDALAA